MKYIYTAQYNNKKFNIDPLTDDRLIVSDGNQEIVMYPQRLADELADEHYLIESVGQGRIHVAIPYNFKAVLLREGYRTKRVRIQAKVTLELVEIDEEGNAIDEKSYMDRSKYDDPLTGETHGPTVKKPTLEEPDPEDVAFSKVEEHFKSLGIANPKVTPARIAFRVPHEEDAVITADNILVEDAHRRGAGIYDGDES